MDYTPLTARQQRELDYHRERARERADIVDEAIGTDIIASSVRRPWNAYWTLYDRLLAADLAGKRVLVLGCGFGEDAIRLGLMGAIVSASDLSPGSIEIARERAARLGLSRMTFDVMTAEATTYPDDHFDAVVFVDILHHVDIPAAIREVRRVLKPGGMIIGDELYTHSSLQRVRESRLVEKLAYPLMQRWIYGPDKPYITADEHKIDEREFAVVTDAMAMCDIDYFGAA
jgi:2-polyprenyl-3-methyl-5-hydroxy-6-metoxy-1,4-benzoquinol methylase